MRPLAALSNYQLENCELELMRHRPPKEKQEIQRLLDRAENRGAAIECWAAINFRNIAHGAWLKGLTGWNVGEANAWADELRTPGSIKPNGFNNPRS